jgi:D-3-phosphoglycerate dehydrogenase
MALTVDSAVADNVTEALKKETGADLVRSVTLVN